MNDLRTTSTTAQPRALQRQVGFVPAESLVVVGHTNGSSTQRVSRIDLGRDVDVRDLWRQAIATLAGCCTVMLLLHTEDTNLAERIASYFMLRTPGLGATYIVASRDLDSAPAGHLVALESVAS